MQYIKYEEVEKMAFSLIKDSNHLKKAMKKMSMKEQDKFVERIIMRTFTIYEL
jgi:hypothetical protein